MAHQPFAIADHVSGIRGEKESWLTPADAFIELENAHLFRNRIERRPSFSEFGGLGRSTTAEDIGTIPASVDIIGNAPALWAYTNAPADPANMNLIANTPVISDDDFIIDIPGANDLKLRLGINIAATNPSAGQSGRIYALDPETPVAGAEGYVDLNTGEWIWYTPGSIIPAGPAFASYNYSEGRPVTLLYEFIDPSGGLVAADTERFYTYNTTEARFEMVDPGGLAPFSLTDEEFLSVTAVQDGVGGPRLLVMTGGNNHPKQWDGATLVDVPANGSRDITAAKMVFYISGHLIYLSPTFGGSERPQMAVWSDQFDHDSVPAANEAVAATEDAIRSAGILKNQLIVFFDRSVWRLQYTADPREGAAFEWVHVAGGQNQRGDSLGSSALASTIMLPDRLMTFGAYALVETNGETVQRATPQLPRLIERLNVGAIQRAYGIVYDAAEEAYFAYPGNTSTGGDSDRALVYNLKNGAVSIYNWMMRCFGIWRRANDAVSDWDDAFPGLTWDEVDVEPDSPGLNAGFPVLLAGDKNGLVYLVPGVAGTVSEDVAMVAETRQLNPFIDQGTFVEADLGWIELFLVPVPGETMTLKLFSDDRDSPYRVETIDLDPDDTSGKIWRTIHVGTTARHHRIRVEATSQQQPVIEAIIPWFQPGGRLEAVR